MLRTRGSVERPALLSLTPRQRLQHFIVKELLPGSALECGRIAVGDRIMSVDGKMVHGLVLPKVQNMIRGPPATTVTLTIAEEGSGREYTVVLMRGGPDDRTNLLCDRPSPESCVPTPSPSSVRGTLDATDELEGDGEDTHSFPLVSSLPSPSPGVDDARGGALTEWEPDCSTFWTVGRKKITNLIASAKDPESVVLTNFRASSELSVPMEDTTRCLHELRLAIASQDADPSAAGRLALIEDVAFLRDQARLARSEIMEEHLFAQRQLELEFCHHNIRKDQCKQCTPAAGFFFGLFSPPEKIRSRPEQEDNQDGKCERCAKLFAHVNNLESQRAHMERAVVRHRLRVGRWEQNRLKAESKMWLDIAQLGASLEQMQLELSNIRQDFDQETAMVFFSSVLLGHKPQQMRGHGRASWASSSLQGSWGKNFSKRPAVQRRSLPVSKNAALVLRQNLDTDVLEALQEEEAGVPRKASVAKGRKDQTQHHKCGGGIESANIEERANKAERENAALKKELSNITNLESKVEELQALRAQEAAELQRIKGGAAYVELMQECKAAEAKIISLTETAAQLEGTKEALSMELTTLKAKTSEMPHLQAELSLRDAQLSQQQAHADCESRKAALLEEELLAVRGRVCDLESQVSSCDTAVEVLRERVTGRKIRFAEPEFKPVVSKIHPT